MLWCFVRLLLPSSGRKRYNVLGAYDPIRHEVVTLTNDTVVNQETFCALLDKIAARSELLISRLSHTVGCT